MLEIAGAGGAGTPLPEHGALVVGSDAKRAQLVLAAPGIDGVHCAFVRAKDGRWAVKDLGSAGGTWLNGTKVGAQALKHGDKVRIAGVELLVRDPQAARGADPHETQGVAKASTKAALELDEIELEPAPAAASAGTAPKVPDSAPKVRGFRLEKQLGKGGMGAVWLAVQENLQRKVALKLLAPRYASDPQFVAQFQREARAAAALNHPNVVTVYDVGEDGGVHYLSMEYMERGTLEDRVGSGRALSPDEVLSILLDATAGLVYAEQRGIVHRDIKPANLMQNHVGQTKIADLGLATHAQDEEPPSGEKKVFGTPHFMPPEQIRGERVDVRSDLYSLGATAYRLLSGRTPFEGKDTKEIVRQVLAAEPRPVREVAPGVDAGLAQVVDRLLKKDPAQRPQGAADLLRALEALADAPAAPAAAAPARKSSSGALVALLMLAASGGAAYYFKDELLARFAPPKDDAAGGAARREAQTAQQPSTAEAQQPQSGTKPVRGGATRPDGEKDDKELQLFEAEAKIAALQLEGQKDLTAAQRREKLLELAQKYAGTTQAADAQRQADEIGATLGAQQAAAAERAAKIEAVLVKLRAACDFQSEVPQPGKSLLAMRLVEGVAELKDDPDFVSRRRDLEKALLDRARSWGQAVLEESGRLVEKGDFEKAEARLKLASEVFDLPVYADAEAPAGYNDLQVVGRKIRERLVNMGAVKEQVVQRQSVEDRRQLALLLGGPGTLEKDLRAFDFDGATARVLAAQAKLSSPAGRAMTQGMAGDLAAAREAFESLGANWGGWRRKGVVDLRERKPANRDAIGADAQGVLVEGSGGPERIPWSAWAGNVKELHKLFNDRLSRPWKPEESAKIAVALRFAALNETLEGVSRVLEGGKKANWTDQDQKALGELWRAALEWEKPAGAGAKEAEAALLLGAALRQATDGGWSNAVASLERLLDAHGDTLLVRLLSDGRALDELAAK